MESFATHKNTAQNLVDSKMKMIEAKGHSSIGTFSLSIHQFERLYIIILLSEIVHKAQHVFRLEAKSPDLLETLEWNWFDT